MSGSSARLQAIEAVTTYHPTAAPLSFANVSASELFGSNVFGKSAMKERLPKPVFKSLMKTIENGSQLDPAIADVVETFGDHLFAGIEFAERPVLHKRILDGHCFV